MMWQTYFRFVPVLLGFLKLWPSVGEREGNAWPAVLGSQLHLPPPVCSAAAHHLGAQASPADRCVWYWAEPGQRLEGADHHQQEVIYLLDLHTLRTTIIRCGLFVSQNPARFTTNPLIQAVKAFTHSAPLILFLFYFIYIFYWEHRFHMKAIVKSYHWHNLLLDQSFS